MRITIDQTSTTATMKLEGRLAAAWISECFRAWQSLIPDLVSKEFWLDVRGLTFVDHSGAELLSEICKQHPAKFITSTPLTKYFAEQALRAGSAKLFSRDKRDETETTTCSQLSHVERE
jgi:anti-anti-sigma regulatory factor